MKDSIVNEVMEMVDTFLSLVTREDELDRQLAAAYRLIGQKVCVKTLITLDIY